MNVCCCSPEVGRVLDLLGLQSHPRVSNWRFSLPSPKHLAATPSSHCRLQWDLRKAFWRLSTGLQVCRWVQRERKLVRPPLRQIESVPAISRRQDFARWWWSNFCSLRHYFPQTWLLANPILRLATSRMRTHTCSTSVFTVLSIILTACSAKVIGSQSTTRS